MASATNTTKPDDRVGVDAALTRRGRRSQIARLIFLSNLLGLAVLIAGMLVLAEVRAGLVRAQADSLRTQGQFISNVLAEAATEGAPIPTMIAGRAREIFQRIEIPDKIRARLYDQSGQMIADTLILQDRVETTPLPPLASNQPQRSLWENIERGWRSLVIRVVSARLAPQEGLKTLKEEQDAALKGAQVAGQRLGDDGQRLISVTLPVQRVEVVVGTLTLESGDVDEILAAERRGLLPFIFVALVVSILSSALLAFLVADPLRRLAEAADNMRKTGEKRMHVPTLTRRRDEIGELAQALEEMTDALGDRIDSNEHLVQDIAHEVKNPLTSISNAVQMARTAKDDPTRERMLGLIQNDVRRIDRLITDVKNAIHLDAELQRASMTLIDMGRLAAEISDIYQQTRNEGSPGVVFVREGDGGKPASVRGYEGPLVQVLRNLIENARTFSPPSGMVTVTLSTDPSHRGPGRLRLTVDDNGPGIPPENLETIFRRFYTSRPEGASFGTHSGLGLSIAREIIEAHGGLIHAENRLDAQGTRKGARFVIDLPTARGI
jgi:two-component system, OmpR family, sensor histidine kinase ChvG